MLFFFLLFLVLSHRFRRSRLFSGVSGEYAALLFLCAAFEPPVRSFGSKSEEETKTGLRKKKTKNNDSNLRALSNCCCYEQKGSSMGTAEDEKRHNTGWVCVCVCLCVCVWRSQSGECFSSRR